MISLTTIGCFLSLFALVIFTIIYSEKLFDKYFPSLTVSTRAIIRYFVIFLEISILGILLF